MISQAGIRDSSRGVKLQFKAFFASIDERIRGALTRGVERLGAQWRSVAHVPLRPFPIGHVPAPMTASALGGRESASFETGVGQRPAHAHDFYRALARIEAPSQTVRAVHAFVATLPSWLAPPAAHKHGDEQIELQWLVRDGRFLRAVIGPDAMVIYSARLGERGRIDGAEPIGDRVSPVVMHAIRQLGL